MNSRDFSIDILAAPDDSFNPLVANLPRSETAPDGGGRRVFKDR